MLIGQISKESGFSKDTIRFYEKRGLIKAKASASEYNNYKNYDEHVLFRLQRIKQAKSFGFTLKEIEELLTRIDAGQATCTFFAQKVNNKLSAIDQEIRELQIKKKNILERIAVTEGNCSSTTNDENCRAIPAQVN